MTEQEFCMVSDTLLGGVVRFYAQTLWVLFEEAEVVWSASGGASSTVSSSARARRPHGGLVRASARRRLAAEA
eukprot:6330657-Prymnesium_polylepis.1